MLDLVVPSPEFIILDLRSLKKDVKKHENMFAKCKDMKSKLRNGGIGLFFRASGQAPNICQGI